MKRFTEVTRASGKAFICMKVALLLLVVLSGCSLFGTSVNDTNTTAETPIPPLKMQFADTWDNIHQFQSFAYNIDNPAAVAKTYDFVWSVAPNQLSAFKSNPNLIASFYVPFYRDGGIYGDQKVGQQRGLANWQNTHPDWVLYQCDKKTPALVDKEPNIPLDFSNPAVINWQVQTYALPASQAGYDAIAADNLNLTNTTGACGIYKNGKWVQLYTGEASDRQWSKNILTWATAFQRALHTLPHPLALIPNVSLDGLPPGDTIVQQIVTHLDAVVDEGGFTNYGTNDLSSPGWLQKMQFIEQVQNLHKAYFLVNAYNTDTLSDTQIQWALGSYLLSKEHWSAIFISLSQQYGSVLTYPEYTAKIGTPQGEMFATQNVYWRIYSGGEVVANPDLHTVHPIKLDGNYVDYKGQPVPHALILQPHTALILLKQ